MEKYKDKCCICIPARYNSSRLFRKLLLKINDKTCIENTIINCKNSELVKDIFVFTDSIKIKDLLSNNMPDIKVFLIEQEYSNGTERIGKNLNYLSDKYKFIINIQADEPFISSKNIDYALKKHIENHENNDLFYTTLHETNNTETYLQSKASIKLITDLSNNVLYYSRNIIPANKSNIILKNYKYKTFTGIYVYNRDKIAKFCELPNSELQNIEDCEQLKILEYGFKIKSFSTIEFNEISLNTEEDYKFLCNKYCSNGNLNNNTKYIFFDFDGVFSDGKIYINSRGEKMKCYNGKDSYGLKLLKCYNNVKLILITADSNETIQYMNHIADRMDYIYSDILNKKQTIEDFIIENNTTWENIAYIGDDLQDIEVMKKAKFSFCPKNAVNDVIKVSDKVSLYNCCEGAVREFCETLISNKFYI